MAFWARRGAEPGGTREDSISDELADSAGRLLADHCTPAVLLASSHGQFAAGLWDAVEQAGLSSALLPEQSGGFGTTVAEAMRLLQLSAAHAAPIPLAETMLAGWLLARCSLPVPRGVLTAAPVRRGEAISYRIEGTRVTVSGRAARVPWGRDAAGMAVLMEGASGPMVGMVEPGGFEIAGQDVNLAGEPRDTLSFAASLPLASVRPAPAGFAAPQLRAAGAALRTVQIAGALSSVLAISVEYAQTRSQFGRLIGRFQAIQHNLAVLAGHSAAAIAAADMATGALAGDLSPLAIGAAKARAGEAASVAAGLAHQVHGAIGFTQEYRLHHLTRRLWAWRDEFGHEAEWNEVVGRAALAAGPDGLWPALTAA